MKFTSLRDLFAVVLLLAGVGEAAFFLPVGFLSQRRSLGKTAAHDDGGGNKFGNESCPCIGFDGIEGETVATIKGKEVDYPADLGGSCEPWDKNTSPECRGDSPPDSCGQKWCYVDPRNCHIPEMPKMSEYQPEATYQNMPLHWSYATCNAEAAAATQEAAAPAEGTSGCRCVGFDNSPGSILAHIGGDEIDYPGELGGQCSAWDEGRHPECAKKDAPDWCKKKWCFVDPCSCSLEVPPKVSDYLGEDATFQGKQVYYSYATCGEEDSYSSKEKLEDSAEALDETCSSTVAGDAFGDEECPCIGFTDIEGETEAQISGSKVKYPADLGGSCKAWDEGLHPECKAGEGGESKELPSWCSKEWCYVDPRQCGIKVAPKMAPASMHYQPDARYQKLPLYYSYSTCGAKDTWAKDTPDVGIDGCQCIGFAGSPGTTKVKIGDKEVEYPAEVGGQCQAWDEKRHPECEGKNPPEWCSQEWCFVDPCSCSAEVPPKTSGYLGDATFQGRQVYYSYAACGAEDSYSSKEQVEASKEAIGKICPKKEVASSSNSTGYPKDYKAPAADIDYNTSKYTKEWHHEWRHGDYPEWDGPSEDDYEVADNEEDGADDEDDDLYAD